MTVVVNDAALNVFLRSTLGPVGQDLAIRVHNVAEKARENASGEIIGIDTGDLIGGINSRIDGTVDGLIGIVNTPARHRGFGYPAFHDQNGRPWLTSALRDRFRIGRPG